MESETNVEERFNRYFSHVESRSRFSICQSAEELVKQADDYGVPLCDEDLLDYLRNLSHNERRAFNMAMGYLFQQISDLDINVPRSEYLFLKAANAPLGDFYNEHRDHASLLRREGSGDLNTSVAATFDGGWYPAENFPPIGRWMGRRGRISFEATPNAIVSLRLATHIPDVTSKPLQVELSINGSVQQSLSLNDNEPRTLELELKDPNGSYEFEFKADRTWQPNPNDREISIAVSDLKLVR
jgi:hypothetical protein